MKKTEHKTAVQAAFTNYVTATATLAQVVQAALKDGVTPAEIREWASEVCSPSHVSRVLVGMGVRIRGKRSDAGKQREADEAVGETLGIIASLFATASSEAESDGESGDSEDGEEGGETPAKPKKINLANVAKRIHDYCNGNTKRIQGILKKLNAEIAKLAAE